MKLTEADIRAKQDWIRQLRELRKDLKPLETRVQTLQALGLQREMRELQSSFDEFQSTISRKVSKARDDLKAVQESITSGHSVEMVKSRIMHLENCLHGAKVYLTSDYYDREQEMKELFEALDSFKLGEYDVPTKAEDGVIKAAKATKVAETFDKSLAVQSKIGKIDRKLAEIGGRNGFWDPRDHDAFLKCLVQSFGNDYLQNLRGGGAITIVPRLLIAISNKNQLEIEEHIQRFRN